MSNSNVNTVAPSTPPSPVSLLPLALASFQPSIVIVASSAEVTGLNGKLTVSVPPVTSDGKLKESNPVDGKNLAGSGDACTSAASGSIPGAVYRPYA